jgi:hypothetical protein
VRELGGARLVDGGQLVAQDADPSALGGDAGLVGLVGVDELVDELRTEVGGEVLEQADGALAGLIDGEPESEGELGGVLEERVVPGRSAALEILSVRGGRQVAAVDRRAAGGVADERPVAE